MTRQTPKRSQKSLNGATGHTHSQTTPHSHSQGHVHSEEHTRQLINRLSRIEGHVRGIKTMIAQNQSCPEVLLQIAAVRGALDRAARMIFDEHLSECIARAVKEESQSSIDAEIADLKAALDRFLP
ncbi:MAG: metal-sensing transcriptional repressor [Jaaginema sp. PMC 1079.18]|nr:metal-sensing transcriptional repressor [Jaaginema sp. PMC 1080.18]MEC4849538.1 metal-sensing transcriptional repressor [Jaaginema sp. PMC 1079.18]MEC4865730.1 metal-sensing transcriptional repressor [Jaaginema sp. PMC 1078.18]